MPKSRPLALERLEDRTTPATSGVAWPDGQHMTLSFVPDGTPLGNNQSNLFRTLNAVAPTASWQHEILRAFETWAANANLNVGVVADSGQALGTGGAVQGDDRFGDIRIAAAPMANGTLITNTAFQWSGTTWSGDVVLNSNYLFSIGGKGGNDLYTAMLNEAGNAFGVLDSHTDPTSGVYYQYNAPKTGINAADVADIQSLYGSRDADVYDAVKANNSLSTATNLGTPLAGVSLRGDIGSTSDTDYYKLTMPVLAPAVVGLTVKVTTSGISTLTPTLQVYDTNMRLIASATATDPLKGDLTVNVGGGLFSVLGQLLGGSNYYIRVAGNSGTGFGVGSYQLDVAYSLANGTVLSVVNGLGSVAGLGGALLSLEDGLDNVVGTALSLPSQAGPTTDDRFDYTYRASISSSTDVDYYKVTAPAASATGTQKMNVLVWGLEQNRLVPKVEVFDAANKPVPAKLLANEFGTYSVEIANSTPGATYYVKVSALKADGSHNVGNYFLGVDYNTQPATVLNTYAAGTLSQKDSVDQRSLTVAKNQLYEFILNADAAAAAEVRMQIFDSAGKLVFTLTSYAGEPASTGHIYLKAGMYTVRFAEAAPSGATLPSTAFTLTGRIISDPIGPRTDGGTSTSSQEADCWSGPSDQTNNSDMSWDDPYYF
jgi:hypothetical protein